MDKSNISSDIFKRMKAFENPVDSLANASINIQPAVVEGSTATATATATPTMMMSSPTPNVQTDADGLILPKKLINPCLESGDRKQLHRELKFTTKMGINVLNQKTELQRAYEKQREKQQQQQQQQQQQNQEQHSPTSLSLKGELNRVIMERAQKHEQKASQRQDCENDDDKQYVNPEYLNVRAKLKQTTELK